MGDAQYESFSRLFEGSDGSAEDFLDASAQSTLLFNSFVGAAAIVELAGGKIEILRMNDRFFDVLGTKRENYRDRQLDPLATLYDESRPVLLETLERALTSRQEAQCELHSRPLNDESGDLWLSARVRFLAHNVYSSIFYFTFENITELHKLMERFARQAETIAQQVDSAEQQSALGDALEGAAFFDEAEEGRCARCSKSLAKAAKFSSSVSPKSTS